MLYTTKDILNAYRKGLDGKKKAHEASKPEREKMAFRFNGTKDTKLRDWFSCWTAEDFHWDGSSFYVISRANREHLKIIELDGKTYYAGILILSDDAIKLAALGRKGGSAKTEEKKAASRENGKKGGRPAIDEFNAEFPVVKDLHSGLWRWRRINRSVDPRRCTFKSKAAAYHDRNQSDERILFNKTGKI